MTAALLEGAAQVTHLKIRDQLVELVGQGPREIHRKRGLPGNRLRQVGGEVLGKDHPVSRRHHRSLDGVLELADVPWPGKGEDQFHCFRSELAGGLTGSCVFLGEVSGQQRDILRAVAQWGQIDLEHVESIEQVFAELPLLDERFQVPIGRTDDADIHLDRLV